MAYIMSPLIICLRVDGHERRIVLPVDKTVNLGRGSSTLGISPEIDFSINGPEARSVSRHHASILRTLKGILIEDLGSVTGTFVNNERLSPFLPEILVDGDELKLGKLCIQVSIQENPWVQAPFL